MHGKAQRDSSILVLLAPRDKIITQLVPYEDFQILLEKTVGMTVQSEFSNNTSVIVSI